MDNYAYGGPFRYERGGGIKRLAEVVEAQFGGVLVVIHAPGAGDRSDVNDLGTVHCMPRSCSCNHNRHEWHGGTGVAEGIQGLGARSAGKPPRKIWLD